MLVSPYKNTTQYTKIQIKPHMMNSDIQNIMKLVLRKKVEKRCNKFGFIDEVVNKINCFFANVIGFLAGTYCFLAGLLASIFL